MVGLRPRHWVGKREFKESDVASPGWHRMVADAAQLRRSEIFIAIGLYK